MSLEPIQQIEEILKKSKDALILLPQNPGGDSIGAGWALYFLLKNKNIKSTVAFSDPFSGADKFNFLPVPENLSKSISGARDFILSFNTHYNKILDVRTEKNEEELRIYITPENGSIDPRDFSFIPAKFKYDLVISLGSPDKESFGTIYEENPDIFYEIPVINIDNHSANDNFGQINLVDITASSTSEIVAEMIDKVNPAAIDENISNCLLAGIISATESFQNRKTTPKSLQISARLMDKGADQQKIVRYLYKTQPFNLLKLWGRTMAQLKWNEDLKLAWAALSVEDFVQSRSKTGDLPLILNKIKDNYSSGKIFLIFYNETPSVVKGLIRFSKSNNLKFFSKQFDGEQKGDVFEFTLPISDIAEAEKIILEKIKKTE